MYTLKHLCPAWIPQVTCTQDRSQHEHRFMPESAVSQPCPTVWSGRADRWCVWEAGLQWIISPLVLRRSRSSRLVLLPQMQWPLLWWNLRYFFLLMFYSNAENLHSLFLNGVKTLLVSHKSCDLCFPPILAKLYFDFDTKYFIGDFHE